MKAMVFTEYGSPDLLELKEVEKPTAADDQVLVKIHASSINEWDWSFISGKPFINRLAYGLRKPKKPILGADIAGVVEAIGANVKNFKPGDEVFADQWNAWGGFAEYVCATENVLVRKPANLTFVQAAAVPQAGILALHGLRASGQIKPGQKVLINGGGGGVGTFAIQVAKSIGTEVTAVDHTCKLETMRSIGADHVIDYTREDFTKNGQQYDLILDVAGYRSISDYRSALNASGIYVMVGGGSGRIFQALLSGLWGWITRRSRKIRVLVTRSGEDLADLKGLIEDGKVLPVIDSYYPLEEIPAAYRRFETGHHNGKIVITLEQDTQV